MDHLLQLTPPSEMPSAATLAGGRGPPGRFRARRLTKGKAVSCQWIQPARVLRAFPHGLVAQLEEHPLCKRGASGSNPDESMALATQKGRRASPDLDKVH